MSFLAPWMLLGLIGLPLVAAAYALARGRRSERARRLAAQGLVVPSVPLRSKRRRHLPFALFLLALAVLVLGWARPVGTIKTPLREATVVLAVDVSNSMAATDIKPTRLAAAKAAAGRIRRPPAVGGQNRGGFLRQRRHHRPAADDRSRRRGQSN